MSLTMSSGILANFLRGSLRHKVSPYMSYHGDFSEVSIKLFSVSLMCFEERAVLIFSNSKSEGWEKKWRIVARYWQKLEDFRKQSILQVDNKNLKTINRTRI